MRTATEAALAVVSGQASAQELLAECLDHIAEREGHVGAWAHLDPEQARAQAQARDAIGPAGPLHGVPVGVKDIIDVVGLPSERGSPIHAGRRPAADAAVVAALRAAGAVMVGKTVTTEFALYAPGKTANPLDPARTPGGSSSGSAAAVADGHVPLALGTQTAGSVVRPAAFCGVYGLKATRGALDRTGTMQLSHTLDALGLFARSLDDLALGLEPLLPQAPRPVGPPRVGITRTYEWDALDHTTRERFDELARRLAQAGIETVDIQLPSDFREAVAMQQCVMNAEAAHALRREYDDHQQLLSDSLRALVQRGRQVAASDYLQALDHAERCRTQLRAVLSHVDVLLAPAVLGEAPVGLDSTGDPLACRVWTLMGTPALAVPWLRGPAGLPLGVQLVGAWNQDRSLVEIGRSLEAAAGLGRQ